MSGTVILNIVIVLGIIIAGGFLIFFMGDLLLSIINPKKDKEALKAKKEKEEEKIKEKIAELSPETAEEVKQIPEVASIVYGGAVVEAYNPEEEEKVEETTEEPPVEEPVEEEEAEDTEVETEETEDDRDAYIAQRRRELMERLARIAEEEDEDEEEEETEETEEVAEVEEAEEVEEIPATPVVDNGELDETKRALAEANARNAALMAEFNALKAQMASQPTEVKPVEEVLLSEEDYLARLSEQEDALKANEKELRACKKEFMPLRRVKKTLENDEKKLRRKEALVAKQKVVLYGVNNYADIDEEKAKKLAEDLDLLDGLKLSVEHCQEVMNKNEERYPLLEKMHDILTAQNAELKASIERTKVELAKVRAKKDDAPAD